MPVIDTPATGTTWEVGEQIFFSGSASDAQDGSVPTSRLSWQLTIRHCPSACHSHDIEAFPGAAGGHFFAPDHEYPAHLELTLTATDAQGVSASTTRELASEDRHAFIRHLLQSVSSSVSIRRRALRRSRAR